MAIRETEQRGIRTKRGNAYSIGILRALRKDRKYTGEYKYGKTIAQGRLSGSVKKEFFKGLQITPENEKIPAKAKEDYLLTAKLFCGDCGRPMTGEGCKDDRGEKCHYYKCSCMEVKSGCRKKAIEKRWIEDMVVELTVSQVLIDIASGRIDEAVTAMQEQAAMVMPALKRQLRKCEGEIRDAVQTIRRGLITETTKECMEDLTQQRSSLKRSIARLQMECRQYTEEEIGKWIGRYRDGSIYASEYRKELIDTFVNSVHIYDEKLILTYNYKPGSRTRGFQEIETTPQSALTGTYRPTHSPEIERFRGFLPGGFSDALMPNVTRQGLRSGVNSFKLLQMLQKLCFFPIVTPVGAYTGIAEKSQKPPASSRNRKRTLCDQTRDCKHTPNDAQSVKCGDEQRDDPVPYARKGFLLLHTVEPVDIIFFSHVTSSRHFLLISIITCQKKKSMIGFIR